MQLSDWHGLIVGIKNLDVDVISDVYTLEIIKLRIHLVKYPKILT